MGLFASLFGKREPDRVSTTGLIWLDPESRLEGLAELTQEAISATDTCAVLLVSHFANLLDDLEQVADRFSRDVPVLVTLTENLSQDAAEKLATETDQVLHIFVAEPHPTREVEQTIESFARQLPCKVQLTFCGSMGDPVLEIFIGDVGRKMLKAIGLEGTEAIESEMVMRRVRGAQVKLQQSATSDLPANSAKEWLEINCPDAKAKQQRSRLQAENVLVQFGVLHPLR